MPRLAAPQGHRYALPGSAASGAKRYAEIEASSADRIPSGIGEFDRVLGGGIVPGSLVLLGGEPGIGKSTLSPAGGRELCADGRAPCSTPRARSRSIRSSRAAIGFGVGDAPLFLLAETCIESILEEVGRMRPRLLVVDSVQTVFSLKFQSAPGSIGQVREAATQFLFTAKGHNIPTFLVGHVTKDGNIAGPKALEHVVDTVLYFEGERHHSHRVVRAVKNRFGAISELGVFEMTGSGLKPVANPSALFLAERPVATPGSAVLCSIEGSRPILVEVQALASTTSYGMAKRMAVGIDPNRLSLLLAVLEKRAGLHLVTDDVFVNIAGGMNIDEPAADLAIVSAVASSVRNRPLVAATAVFGEVGSGRRGPRCAAGGPAHSRGRADGLYAHRPARRPTSTASSRHTDTARAELVGVRHVGEALDALLVLTSIRASRSTVQLVISVSYRSEVHGLVHPGATALYGRGRVYGVSAPPSRSRSARQRAVRSRPGRPRRSVRMAAARSGAHQRCSARCSAALSGWRWRWASARRSSGPITASERVAFLDGFLLLLLPYLGLVIGGRKGEWLEPARLMSLFRASGPQRRYKILDTSVIIDGRIADLCDTGFMDGTLVIPQFVLKELQLVADSADSMKRNRGRRGLDILQKIQKMSGVEVTISDADYPEVREVDLKLIELARTLQGKIVTNDFNLNKVAQLRGVDVLNINELANALKPVVLPGEIMKVFILKEGKEYNQGVAYLDDGTMVVVDNARKMISKTIDVVVTSVLQTTAGKMIFGRYIDPNMASQGQASQSANRNRADRRGTFSRRRPRRRQAGDAHRLPPRRRRRMHERFDWQALTGN